MQDVCTHSALCGEHGRYLCGMNSQRTFHTLLWPCALVSIHIQVHLPRFNRSRAERNKHALSTLHFWIGAYAS
jgi:hypothetical protein